jgi:hypothetical protein
VISFRVTMQFPHLFFDGCQSLSSASLYAARMTGTSPLRPDLHTSMLRALRVAASLGTSASGRGCLTPSCTGLTVGASPRLTLTDGAKSFLTRLQDPHYRTLWCLNRTLCCVVAFRHSSTNAASTVCPTITVRPPARDTCDVCAASTSITSLGNERAAQVTSCQRCYWGCSPPAAREVLSPQGLLHNTTSHLRHGGTLIEGRGASPVEHRH